MGLSLPAGMAHVMAGWDPIFVRLAFASAELVFLSLLVAILIRFMRGLSPRVVACLWLVVLAKPIVSLTVGNLVPVVAVPVFGAACSGNDKPFYGQVVSDADFAGGSPGWETPARIPVATSGEGDIGVSNARYRWNWSISEGLTLVWGIGAALLLGRYILIRGKLHGIVVAARPPSESLLSKYCDVAADVGIGRPPPLLLTQALESPAVVGIWSPVVLLPSWLAEDESGRTLEPAIRHELAHLRCFDTWAVMVRDLLLVLFYFHPVAWWAGHRMAEAMELACDRSILRRSDEAPGYAESLYSILKKVRTGRREIVAGGLFATRTQVGKRIAALLEPSFSVVPQVTRYSAFGLAVFACIALVCGLGIRGQSVVAQSATGTEEEAFSATPFKVEPVDADSPIAALRALGADIRSIPSASGDSHTLHVVIHADITDAQMAYLCPLKNLTQLEITSANVTDAGLVHLQDLPMLAGLTLTCPRVADEGLSYLRDLSRLEYLGVRVSCMRGSGLTYLSSLDSLHILYLMGSPINSDALSHLVALEGLKSLVLQLEALNDDGLFHVGQMFNLRGLWLFQGDGITNDGLRYLAGLTQLKRLWLDGPQIGDAGIANIRALLTNLEELSVCRANLTEASVEYLSLARHLRELHLYEVDISDETLDAFQRVIPHARIEVFTNTSVGNEHPAAVSVGVWEASVE